MGPGFLGRLSTLGLEVTARLEIQGTTILIHIERIRLGPIPVPATLALGYVRKSLAGRPGITVDAGGRTIALDVNGMNLLGPDLTVNSFRFHRGRVTVRLGPAGEPRGS